jgi:hypothetical protein
VRIARAEVREHELDAPTLIARIDLGERSGRREIGGHEAGRNPHEDVVALARVPDQIVAGEVMERAGQHQRDRHEGVCVVVGRDDEVPTRAAVGAVVADLRLIVVQVDDLDIDRCRDAPFAEPDDDQRRADQRGQRRPPQSTVGPCVPR